jgi:hypothetical protein
MSGVVLLFNFEEFVYLSKLSNQLMIKCDLEHLVSDLCCFSGVLLDEASIFIQFYCCTIVLDGSEENFPLFALHLSFIIYQICIYLS